jgi:hypothetical protein
VVSNKITLDDLKQINLKGIRPDRLDEQLKIFREGMLYVQLIKPCVIDNGIIKIGEKKYNEYLAHYASAASSGRLMKFVPASGAATRMFKELASALTTISPFNRGSLEKAAHVNADAQFSLNFFKSLNKFPFYDEIKGAMRDASFRIDDLLSKGDYKPIIEYLLFPKGLDYLSLPKGLIKFHSYPDGSRTPFHEQIQEAVNYTSDANKKVKIHFTVSEEYLEVIRKHVTSIIKDKYGDYKILHDYSVQGKSTDTLAVDANNKPFRDSSGKLVFRPGGHGSLIGNLNKLNADIVFIKNIDNVTLDWFKSSTVQYKKLLSGLLICLQKKMFEYLEKLNKNNYNRYELNEIVEFVESELYLKLPKEYPAFGDEKLAQILFDMMNRPIRVCGMVKNEGEPGGGPYWVKDNTGNISRQIVEAAQINLLDPQQEKIFRSSTHFNPVDIVCGVRNFKNEKFDLLKYVDHKTGFITIKSCEGRELKAYEHPGLWNGAMAGWISLFVDVPISTFSPVKSVNDLLRREHNDK